MTGLLVLCGVAGAFGLVFFVLCYAECSLKQAKARARRASGLRSPPLPLQVHVKQARLYLACIVLTAVAFFGTVLDQVLSVVGVFHTAMDETTLLPLYTASVGLIWYLRGRRSAAAALEAKARDQQQQLLLQEQLLQPQEALQS